MDDSSRELISNHLHFVWLGNSLPDFAHVALRSALGKNPGSVATLWHDETFVTNAETEMMKTLGLKLRLIQIEVLLGELASEEPSLDTQRLLRIYRRLQKPAARANMIRLLVLYLEGGIYLDTDTLTVKNLASLRKHGAFIGQERILWPSGTWRTDLRPLALNEVRRICSLLPLGYRLHQKMLPFYSLAANNAVFGAARRHPLLRHMLEEACHVRESEWTRRFRFGTHLLQDCLRTYLPREGVGSDAVKVLPPEYFYPVGPEVSKHYFKTYKDPASVAAELLSEETHVIHWYASVANLLDRGYEHIFASSQEEVYSFLCKRHVTSFQAPYTTQEAAAATSSARGSLKPSAAATLNSATA